MTARFAAGQVVTVFRSTPRTDADPSVDPLDAQLRERAAGLGGLVEVKSFVADDGEKVTVVTFEDRAAHERWATDSAHLAAQKFGRESVYASYSIQVGDCTRAVEVELRS